MNTESNIENKPEQETTTETKELLCPKAGTATSSPANITASQSDMNIVNVMLWDATQRLGRINNKKGWKSLTKPEWKFIYTACQLTDEHECRANLQAKTKNRSFF